MSKDPKTTFLKHIKKAKTEEVVITAYHQLLPGEWDQVLSLRCFIEADCLFAFSCGGHIASYKYVRVLATCCYYLNRIWRSGEYKGVRYVLPAQVAICDDSAARVFLVDELRKYFTSDKYDWSRSPSSPDPKLVKAVGGWTLVYPIQTISGLEGFLQAMTVVDGKRVPGTITADNAAGLFLLWLTLFPYERDYEMLSWAYLADLCGDSVVNEAKGMIAFFADEAVPALNLPNPDAYNDFWRTWRRNGYGDYSPMEIWAHRDACVAAALTQAKGV